MLVAHMPSTSPANWLYHSVARILIFNNSDRQTTKGSLLKEEVYPCRREKTTHRQSEALPLIKYSGMVPCQLSSFPLGVFSIHIKLVNNRIVSTSRFPENIKVPHYILRAFLLGVLFTTKSSKKGGPLCRLATFTCHVFSGVRAYPLLRLDISQKLEQLNKKNPFLKEAQDLHLQGPDVTTGGCNLSAAASRVRKSKCSMPTPTQKMRNPQSSYRISRRPRPQFFDAVKWGILSIRECDWKPFKPPRPPD